MSTLLSQPQDVPHRLLRWVSQYQREIVLTLVLGLAFFGGIAGWLSWQERAEKKAQVALFESQNKNEGLSTVVKDFSGTQAGLLALIALGGNARDAADFDGCISYFQRAYENAGKETYFRVLALQEVGTCYRAKADYKKAAEFFDRAAKEPGNKASLASRFEAIRCHQLDKNPQTDSLYQALLAEKNLDPELQEAIEEQLLWLKLQKGS